MSDGAQPQQTLFAFPNPLLERLGAAFFKALPREPGVYFFKDASGAILYIGKAKNLRNRLNSYKNARPGAVSRKTLRLLRRTRVIEVQLCVDETSALLTENRLLREHRPPFNVVNTRVDTYFFIVMKTLSTSEAGARVRFQLTTDPKAREREGGRAFGVYKGRSITRHSFQALLRLLNALEADDGRFYFPPALVRHRVASPYESTVPRALLPLLYMFLNGRSRRFLSELTIALLANEEIPEFVWRVITEDLKRLDGFYEYGPLRLRRLKKKNGIRRRLVAQDEIDDLLVLG